MTAGCAICQVAIPMLCRAMFILKWTADLAPNVEWFRPDPRCLRCVGSHLYFSTIDSRCSLVSGAGRAHAPTADRTGSLPALLQDNRHLRTTPPIGRGSTPR